MTPNHADRPDARPRLLSRLVPARARLHVLALAVGVSAVVPTLLVDRSLGQPRDEPATPAASGAADGATRVERDVSVFGLRAEPGSARIDPMLSPYAAPLRKLLPDHALTLLGAESRRLSARESLSCDLGDGRTVLVTLRDPLDDGKVHLSIQLLAPGRDEPVFVTQVRAPAGQLVFLDKAEDGSEAKLLLGIGAR